MHLGYGIIGVITGFILGIFIMKLKNRNLHQQKISQDKTFKNTTQKFNKHQKELSNFFNQNIQLLDIISNYHRKLYQHVLKNSNIFIINNRNEHDVNINHSLLKHQDTQQYYDTNTNQFLKKVLEKAPKDYAENNKH